jgi:CheY-like chemotaxis protein
MVEMAGKGSLLFVEDNPELRMSLEYFLHKIGYDIVVAGSATEGLLKWRENRPRAVLLDIQLPDKSGYSLCEKIKQESLGDETAVIFISGRSEQEMMAAGNRVNADYYVRKPVDPVDLGADFYFLFGRNFDLPRHELLKLRVIKDIPKFRRLGIDPLEEFAREDRETFGRPSSPDMAHEGPSGEPEARLSRPSPDRYVPLPDEGKVHVSEEDKNHLLHLFELLVDIRKNMRKTPYYLLNDDQKTDLLNKTEERVEAIIQHLSRLI